MFDPSLGEPTDPRAPPPTLQHSPVRSNPDTTIIRKVVASFGIVPGLDACRKLVICDGFQIAGPGAPPK